MITIENKEDIELLLTFFERLNLSDLNKLKSEDTPQKSQADFEEIENMIDAKIKKHMITVENAIPVIVEKTLSTESDTPQTIRNYGERTFKELPHIKHMKKNGYFILGRNRTSVYTIQDVLKLKPLIPQMDVTFDEMGEKIGVSHFTARTICCAIEMGLFDEYIEEWKQMEANKFYNNRKSVMVENNPQKRKESGMV